MTPIERLREQIKRERAAAELTDVPDAIRRILDREEKLLEVVEFYADSTNFEAVNVGRNYSNEYIVEEYNKITVSGDEMGSAARAVIEELAKGVGK